MFVTEHIEMICRLLVSLLT